MLPVRRLLAKELQTTTSGHRPINAGYRTRSDREMQHYPNGAPLYGPGYPRSCTPKPRRVLRGAPPHIPHCYDTAAPRPHGRTHRKVSLFRDDICDGMLPVKPLLYNELHTSGGRQPMPDVAHE
jgi:hypothetical protein